MNRRSVSMLTVCLMIAAVGCSVVRSRLPMSHALKQGAVTRIFNASMVDVLEIAQVTAIEDFQTGDAVGLDLDDLTYSSNPPKSGLPDFATGLLVLDPEEIDVQSCQLSGKTKDNRTLTIWFQARDHEQKTEVTILIGQHGDARLSTAFLDRVADRLDHLTPAERAKRKSKVAPVTPASPPVMPDPKPGPQP